MDIHKNLNQTTELDSARNDLSVEKKLLDCIENLVMNDDFTAAVNSGLTTILEYYDADRTYIFEFQWKENLLGIPPKFAEMVSLRRLRNCRQCPLM
ncbi:MAG: hypothetical protein ACLUZQ_01095 [Butyricicoccus sp.]